MTEDDRQPLSEEAALRQLEELHREIERTRLRRKDANDAFDRFLRSFDRSIAPPPAAEPEPRRPPMPAPPAPRPEIGRLASPPSRPVEPPAPPAQLPPAPPAPPPPPPASERVFAPPPAREPVFAPTRSAEPVSAAPAVPAPESTHEDEIVTLMSPDPSDRVPQFRSEEAVPLAVHTAEPPLPVDLRALEAARPRSTDESLSLDEWEQQSGPTVTTAAFPAEADIVGARRPAAPREARPVPVALTVPVARAGPRIPLAIVVLGIVVLGSIVFFLWRGSSGDAGSTERSAPEAAAVQPQPPAAAATAPVAPPQAPPFAELSTVRRAWVRVVVDGRKVIERELPADSRVPIEPGSQIVVRAGDAGAVRVAIGGKDQGAVGADGQAATKIFVAKTGR